MSVWLLLASLGALSDGPELKIDGPRVINIKAGLAGQGARKRVELTARLEGELESAEGSGARAYYCLDEEWDWDDGAFSLQEPDCDPYEPGADIRREWRESHYFGPGRYFITFSLMDGDEVVAKATHEIHVYGSAVLRRDEP